MFKELPKSLQTLGQTVKFHVRPPGQDLRHFQSLVLCILINKKHLCRRKLNELFGKTWSKYGTINDVKYTQFTTTGTGDFEGLIVASIVLPSRVFYGRPLLKFIAALIGISSIIYRLVSSANSQIFVSR